MPSTMIKGYVQCAAGVVASAARDYVTQMKDRQKQGEEGFLLLAEKVIGRPKVSPPWYKFWVKPTDRACTKDDIHDLRVKLDFMWYYERADFIKNAGFSFEWPRPFETWIENGQLVADTMSRFAPNDIVLVKLKDARWLGIRTRNTSIID